jgi:hypothetical protein
VNGNARAENVCDFSKRDRGSSQGFLVHHRIATDTPAPESQHAHPAETCCYEEASKKKDLKSKIKNRDRDNVDPRTIMWRDASKSDEKCIEINQFQFILVGKRRKSATISG